MNKRNAVPLQQVNVAGANLIGIHLPAEVFVQQRLKGKSIFLVNQNHRAAIVAMFEVEGGEQAGKAAADNYRWFIVLIHRENPCKGLFSSGCCCQPLSGLFQVGTFKGFDLGG